MKVIGLLGGMSWESSIVYERIINEEVRRRLGGHSADLLIRSYNFADIEPLQSAGEWDQAGRLLADGARTLEAGGAELLLLCTNTMHTVADVIAAAVNIPFIPLVPKTCATWAPMRGTPSARRPAPGGQCGSACTWAGVR